MKEWQKLSKNIILQADGFFISYNPDTSTLGSGFKGDGDGKETAIVVEEPRKYFILNGDHRKAYEKLVDKGLAGCMDYFHSKPELKSSWSE